MRLTQQQAAWLLGKSPGWLREHAEVFERDSAGRYNARQAVAALLNLESERRVEYIDIGNTIERARKEGLL